MEFVGLDGWRLRIEKWRIITTDAPARKCLRVVQYAVPNAYVELEGKGCKILQFRAPFEECLVDQMVLQALSLSGAGAKRFQGLDHQAADRHDRKPVARAPARRIHGI